MRINYLLLLLIAVCTVPHYFRNEDHLLQDFHAETDLVRKEQLLNKIVRQRDAGSALLRVAMRTDDILTKWRSIRGIGMVKYVKAVPYITHIRAIRRKNDPLNNTKQDEVFGLCSV